MSTEIIIVQQRIRSAPLRRRRVSRLVLLGIVAYCAAVWALVIAAVW
jgi:hypothetical protein